MQIDEKYEISFIRRIEQLDIETIQLKIQKVR
jgi:hypothetical protein